MDPGIDFSVCQAEWNGSEVGPAGMLAFPVIISSVVNLCVSGSDFVKLVKEQGVKLRRFNDDIYDSFGEAAEEVFEEVRGHSNLAGRIHASFLHAREELGAWAKISDQAYVEQRNRVLGL